MKFLVKTDDYASLDEVDYGRVVYDTTNDKVFLQNIGGVEYDYVDLGLPSQLKWAKCNIGANSEEESGLYFQWGDSQGYTTEQVGTDKQFTSNYSDYKFGTSANFTKYNSTDRKTTLDPEDDAAHVIMGGNWRMPTFEEYKELCLNTEIYLVPNEGEEIKGTAQEQSGSVMIKWASRVQGTFKGVKFYKKGDKQTYMFVPASGYAAEGSVRNIGRRGYLWSSSLISSDVQSPWHFYFNVDSGSVGNEYRYYGIPVRGVLA